MSGLFVVALDRDVAGHLAVALRRHRDSLREHGLGEPAALAQLEAAAMSVVTSRQQASVNVTDSYGTDDGLHERQWLTRHDAHRLTGASVSTVDRWIRDGKLRSTRRGRSRRIARADLDAFLAAA